MVQSVRFTGPRVGLNGDGSTQAQDGDGQTGLPPSPRDIQVSAADVGAFDQTFLAESQNFGLEGEFSPAPFPLQVLPRVAYTITYNMVWNPDRQRWEADTGNGSGEVTALYEEQFTVSDGGVASLDTGVTDQTKTVDTAVSIDDQSGVSEVPEIYKVDVSAVSFSSADAVLGVTTQFNSGNWRIEARQKDAGAAVTYTVVLYEVA